MDGLGLNTISRAEQCSIFRLTDQDRPLCIACRSVVDEDPDDALTNGFQLGVV
jgi:hypothetical protein